MSVVIYYYPDPVGPVRKLSLTYGLRAFEAVLDESVSFMVGPGGYPARGLSPGVERVSFEYGFVNSDWNAEARELAAIERHLQLGGAIGFARDGARTWCGLSTNIPEPGDTAIATGGNAFSAWSGSAALSSSYSAVVETAQPYSTRELCSVSSVSGATVTLGEGLRFAHPTRVLLRDADFYPTLYLDPKANGGNQLLYQNGSRVRWGWRGVLTYSPALAVSAVTGGSADSVDLGRVSDSYDSGLLDDTAPRFTSGLTLADVMAPRGSFNRAVTSMTRGRWPRLTPGGR